MVTTTVMVTTLVRISAGVFKVSFAIIRKLWRWTFTMSASKKKQTCLKNLGRDCCSKFETGLNIRIGIVQKV